jgi:hypothetical protein
MLYREELASSQNCRLRQARSGTIDVLNQLAVLRPHRLMLANPNQSPDCVTAVETEKERSFFKTPLVFADTALHSHFLTPEFRTQALGFFLCLGL